ncbi:UNKNOWN [Stylonychia lemnae]|uniref:Methyltransferase domain-containing protein n=1 Tax=Stylonychia lemnae TaxID=5949 RepID=A0A077ZW56_STYLE|nr:UNKNOWN [Stylonychia lemnae]|eukprot:CDW72686.1 UNKNOWN [Stylonychia lemnae]
MPNYGDPQYWDQRYKEQEGTIFDWLEDYEAIEPLLDDIFQKRQDYSETDLTWRENLRILNLGCGNSILPEEMYDKGYKNIYNIDISHVVIEQMAKRNAINRPETLCVDGSYMSISYGTPENRVLHYKRPHLKFTVSTFEIAPEGKKSQDAVHYVYVCKKQEGAEEQCAINWAQVQQQIKKEECDDLLEDSDQDEEESKKDISDSSKLE